MFSHMGCARSFESVATAFLCLFLALLGAQVQLSNQSTPAVFIFGDSLADAGNNNYIPSLAKANSLPYGIDFPKGPTGRFTNGRTVVDVVCELAGLPFIPPYLDPSTKGANILKGVNYASGAGGIIASSGANFIARIPLSQQIDDFKNTIGSLQQQLGDAGTATLISKSLFAVIIGNNDYINNYLLSFNTDVREEYLPQSFQDLLTSTLSQELQSLYQLGARKFVVSNIGPLGCIPFELSQQRSPDGKCIQFINTYIQNYNAALKSLLNQLSSSLSGATFLYANSYDIVSSVVNNPASFGFKVIDQGCCGGGQYNGQIPCLLAGSYCSDRNDFLFWDQYHPTDAFNAILGQRFYSGGPDDISPMNVQQLLQT